MKEFIDKLIERLEEREVQAYAKMDGGVTYQAYRNATETVIELAEEYKDGWIVCSERLPEKAGKYLVTINCGGAVHTTVRRFNPKPKHPKQNEPLFTKHIPLYSGWERRTCGVIAWKDLPAPYTEGE